MVPFTASTVSSESLKLVEDEYSKLQGAIDELGTSINKTIQEQKNDIELTHQKDMKKVEEEIEQHSRENARLEDEIANNLDDNSVLNQDHRGIRCLKHPRPVAYVILSWTERATACLLPLLKIKTKRKDREGTQSIDELIKFLATCKSKVNTHIKNHHDYHRH